MPKIVIFLSVIASLFLLGQWYVFISVRKYLFERYTRISRKEAYLALGLMGLANYALAQLSFDPDILPADSFARKAVSVFFFTCLGSVGILCAYFALLWPASVTVKLKDRIRALLLNPKGGDGASSESSAPNSSERAETRRAAVGPEKGLVGGRHSPRGESCGSLPLDAVEDEDISRRSFLKWGAAAGLASAVFFSGRAIAQAYGNAVVEEFELEFPGLAGLDRPITALQISDVHFGMFVGAEELQKMVETVNSIEADILLVTGDIFHSPLTVVEDAVPILKQLKPRRLGNYAIMGNHDFYAGDYRCIEAIKNSGLILLRDQWITLNGGSAKIHLGGMDDPMSNWLWGMAFPNFPGFMRKAPREPGLRLVLSHRPAVLPLASDAGIDLVLAGHTHGGQIIMPSLNDHRGLSLARLVSPYTHGWYRQRDCSMYLNRGVGLTFVPWRLNCPPEITVFRLRGAMAA
ncbi:MAG: metallophosphoesterase [Deltaproteobacteria bacterium]|nr:metallophosphoesterase [Deltaproteobacteria bacterium]